MKKLFAAIVISSLAFIATGYADDQETVDHCAGIIRDFRHMPEKSIPRHVLRNAKGLAIMSVVKAGFIFSGKAGHGVVVARTGVAGPVLPSLAPAARAGVCRLARKKPMSFLFLIITRPCARFPKAVT